jgi:cyclic dehypoxanthinyl futalosine synthase
MGISKEQALDMLRSDDLLGVGAEADAVRKRLHPGNVVTYQIDRNINYTNICTEYCSFCAFYRPVGSPEGYIQPLGSIFQKIEETIALGGTGVLMQGGLHPDLKIDYYENLLRSIKQCFPEIHLHCFSAPEVLNIAEVSGLPLRETLVRLMDAGLDSIPGGGAEILDDEVRRRIASLKCTTEEWLLVHRTAHDRYHDVWLRRDARAPRQPLRARPPVAGGHWRLYRLHSLVLPARSHLAREHPQGRGDGGGLSQDARRGAHLSG